MLSKTKKKCVWSNTLVSDKNMARHVATCIYKTDLNARKDYILELLAKNPDQLNEGSNTNKLEMSELANQEMLRVIKQAMNEFKFLYERFADHQEETPEEKIENLSLADSTKYGYKVEWRLFQKWRKQNNLTISERSMNTYLSTIKCRGSTKFKKRNVLQNILKVVVDPNAKLNKMRMRFSVKPKYSLSDAEVQSLLEEQKDLNTEHYIIMKMMIFLVLRIGTIAALQLKHFDFFGEENIFRIALPDGKNQTLIFKDVDQDFKAELEEYLESVPLASIDDYVFYREGNNETLTKRSSFLGVAINKKLAESKAMVKSENFQYTSHMLRKCLPNLRYNEVVEEAKEEARKLLGHKTGSTAVNSYLDK